MLEQTSQLLHLVRIYRKSSVLPPLKNIEEANQMMWVITGHRNGGSFTCGGGGRRGEGAEVFVNTVP
jgi:hypothetical protein